MKTFIAALAALAPAIATAHELGGPHAHPHPDAGLLALAALLAGVVAVAALRRGRR